VDRSSLQQSEFKAMWSLLRQSGVAKLVTVHFLRQELAMQIPGERIKLHFREVYL